MGVTEVVVERVALSEYSAIFLIVARARVGRLVIEDFGRVFVSSVGEGDVFKSISVPARSCEIEPRKTRVKARRRLFMILVLLNSSCRSCIRIGRPISVYPILAFTASDDWKRLQAAGS